MTLCVVQMRAPTMRAAQSWSGGRSGTQTVGGGPGRCTQTRLVRAINDLLILVKFSGHGLLPFQQFVSLPELQKGQSAPSAISRPGLMSTPLLLKILQEKSHGSVLIVGAQADWSWTSSGTRCRQLPPFRQSR